jgi:hypothetical protein
MAEFANPLCMRRLMQSVQALALPADVQLSLFPDLVRKADELALDFGFFWDCVKGNDVERLTAEQTRILDEINSQLDSMSGAQDAELWTDEALLENPLWGRTRVLAKAALVAFNWPREVPPNENVYIPGKRTYRS